MNYLNLGDLIISCGVGNRPNLQAFVSLYLCLLPPLSQQPAAVNNFTLVKSFGLQRPLRASPVVRHFTLVKTGAREVANPRVRQRTSPALRCVSRIDRSGLGLLTKRGIRCVPEDDTGVSRRLGERL